MPDVHIDTDTTVGAGSRDGDPATPYISWNEAWEAEDANITGGSTWNFFFRGAAADTAKVTIDGVFGGTAVTLNFYPWHREFGAEGSADDGWYRGNEEWSEDHYRLFTSQSTGSDHEVINVNMADSTNAHEVLFQALQIGGDGTSRTRLINTYDADSVSAWVRMRQCRFNNESTYSGAGGPRVFYNASSAVHSVEYTNNLSVDDGTEDMSVINLNESTAGSKVCLVYNNTHIKTNSSGGEDFLDDVSGWGVTAKNNVCYATGGGAQNAVEMDTDSAGTGGSDTKDYNASVQSDDRGTNGYTLISGDFEDYAGGDYRPKASQTHAWGTNGETNADDSDVPTVDINGYPRNYKTGEGTAIGCFTRNDEGNRIYVDTDTVVAPGSRDGAAATPYEDWDEAWEAEDANILADRGIWNFYLKGTAADTVRPVIDGAFNTTGDPCTVNFYPWHTTFGAESDADDGWYTGNDELSTSHYRLDTSVSGSGDTTRLVILDWGFQSSVTANRVNIQGLQFRVTGSGATPICVEARQGNAVEWLDVHQCRMVITNTGSNPRFIRTDSGGPGGKTNVYSTNVLMTYNGTLTASGFNHNDSGPPKKESLIYNVTAVYTSTGGEDFIDDVTNWTCTVKNVVAYANDVAADINFDLIGGDDTIDHNASQTSGDRGTNGFAIVTGDFENYSGADYRPAASQTNAWGTGGESNDTDAWAPYVDITGTAHPASAPIGAFNPAPSSGSTDDLLADDVEFAMEVTAPAIGQLHKLLADDVEMAMELSVPVLGQVHKLQAEDVEMAMEVTAPVLTSNDNDNLLAEDVEFAMEVSTPVMGQLHKLTGVSVEMAMELSVPVLGQVHKLQAEDVEMAMELTVPTAGIAEPAPEPEPPGEKDATFTGSSGWGHKY